MKFKLILSWITVPAIIIAVAFTSAYKKEKSLIDYMTSYMDTEYKIEREFIESIPVYRDFATPALESELRKYNLKDHAVEVVKHGIAPLKNLDDINVDIKNGTLVSIDSENDKNFYFHNVKKEFRYLTPQGKSGLETVAERFQTKLQGHKTGLPAVKFAVSSVIRTVDYQETIFGRKFVSEHSYGGCFDIFFDDYFVQMPVPGNTGKTEDKIRKALHGRIGFLMGDALREQFRTVLMETLLELQKEKKIYAFLEDDRRCYHITVLVK